MNLLINLRMWSAPCGIFSQIFKKESRAFVVSSGVFAQWSQMTSAYHALQTHSKTSTAMWTMVWIRAHSFYDHLNSSILVDDEYDILIPTNWPFKK